MHLYMYEYFTDNCFADYTLQIRLVYSAKLSIASMFGCCTANTLRVKERIVYFWGQSFYIWLKGIGMKSDGDTVSTVNILTWLMKLGNPILLNGS